MTYGGGEVYFHTFLTSARDGGEWSVSRTGRFTPRKEDPVPTEYEAGWAPESAWTRWRREKIAPRNGESNLGRPARSLVPLVPVQL
jgi:hypothetical protein